MIPMREEAMLHSYIRILAVFLAEIESLRILIQWKLLFGGVSIFVWCTIYGLWTGRFEFMVCRQVDLMVYNLWFRTGGFIDILVCRHGRLMVKNLWYCRHL